MSLKEIKLFKDKRLNADFFMFQWDKEMQQIKLEKKNGRLFRFSMNDEEGIYWFCVPEGNRHYTIYDMQSGYQVCWVTSLAKAKELMNDPAFAEKVNRARKARHLIKLRNGREELSPLVEEQFDELKEKYQ